MQLAEKEQNVTHLKRSKEILGNCEVLISFQNYMQKEVMQELLNIEAKQKEHILIL